MEIDYETSVKDWIYDTVARYKDIGKSGVDKCTQASAVNCFEDSRSEIDEEIIKYLCSRVLPQELNNNESKEALLWMLRATKKDSRDPGFMDSVRHAHAVFCHVVRNEIYDIYWVLTLNVERHKNGYQS